MASGNAFSPSTTTIRTSPTPRAFNSFINPNQSFAPYCDAVHEDRRSWSGAVPKTPQKRSATGGPVTLIKSTGDGFESLRSNQPHASKAHRSGAQATRGGLRRQSAIYPFPGDVLGHVAVRPAPPQRGALSLLEAVSGRSIRDCERARHSHLQSAASSALVSRSRAMPTGGRRSLAFASSRAYCQTRRNRWQRTLFAARVTGGKV